MTEDLYCSQQICIPPLFPFVIKQYAKAAIRTQPGDLLRWSAAYFRCLALNLPLPVKSRLEFPIPRNYEGITPGWLRTILYQFGKSWSVPFKQLWDRWIGACLAHDVLTKLLVLGDFHDPANIPLYRFIGLCASLLTNNLTETMILFCEVFSEEPEGGSAMIEVEIFNDVYTFLAAIDGSKAQFIYNLYFKDSLLGLYTQKEVSLEPSQEHVEEEAYIPKEEEVMEETLVKEEASIQDGSQYSCMDIKDDKGGPVQEEQQTTIMETKVRISLAVPDDSATDFLDQFTADQEDLDIDLSTILSLDDNQELREESINLEEEDRNWESDVTIQMPIDFTQAKASREPNFSIFSAPATLYEDSLPSVHSEEPEAEEMKESSEDSLSPKRKYHSVYPDFYDDRGDSEVYIEAIPGIGPVVPTKMVEAVVAYMLSVSKEQHGMVLPKNIRHFSCPPLQIAIDWSEKEK